MKSLMDFLQMVLDDLSTWCNIDATLDLKKIQGRVEHEGFSFLTITLASFGKEFERALDQGFVGPDQFTGFAKTGGLPRFLGGFLDQVFDRNAGCLLDEPSIAAIWAIRQLTLMWAKMELPCTEERTRKAYDGYIECEKEVETASLAISGEDRADFRRVASLLFGDVLSVVEQQLQDGKIVPRHGPGAVADKLTGNGKWRQSEWTRRLEDGFAFGDHPLLPNWRYWEHLQSVDFLEPGAERPTRVISVPKTLEKPRIIAIEPTCMQYMQQGLMAAFNEAIRDGKQSRWLVDSSSQVPNQHLAREGSRNGALATLDLSEASDRVSNQHVRDLLYGHYLLTEAVDACRSRKADVPGHGVITLAKFASMGSALTFVMEAMVFSTVIFLAIERELKRPLSLADITALRGKVRVYGDDIIVPVGYVDATVSHLEAFGFRVNTGKSFWTGKFRESCGKDYYDGTDVSLVRIRQPLPHSRTETQEILSTVSLRNQLYFAGMWQSCRWLDSLLSRVIPYPAVHPESPVVGRHSFLGYDEERMCSKLHKPLVRGVRVRAVSPTSPLDDIGALLKWFILRGEEPLDDPDHLERSGRARDVALQSGWWPSCP